MAWCVHKSSPTPEALRSVGAAFDIISIRGRHGLNMRPVSSDPITIQINHPWNIGSLAWDMRNKKCKDDKDRVYALLSLTRSSLDYACTPDSFLPDYTRPVEWAYHQFWRRYGGFPSLFYAGLFTSAPWQQGVRGRGRINLSEGRLFTDMSPGSASI